MAIDNKIPSMDNDPRSAQEYWKNAFELWKSQMKCKNCKHWEEWSGVDVVKGETESIALEHGKCSEIVDKEIYDIKEDQIAKGLWVAENFGCIKFENKE